MIIEPKEEFKKAYQAFMKFNEWTTGLKNFGIDLEESDLENFIYASFDAVANLTLSDEGLEILYEEVMWHDLEIEEVMNQLNDYFL